MPRLHNVTLFRAAKLKTISRKALGVRLFLLLLSIAADAVPLYKFSRYTNKVREGKRECVCGAVLSISMMISLVGAWCFLQLYSEVIVFCDITKVSPSWCAA